MVLQSDFGLVDGAVAAMQGVAKGVAKDLELFNLTHDIPPFNTWEASYRIFQTIRFWPAGTVFVSVVDPGVGSKRKSVVAKTKSGSYIVTPDNGTLTHLHNINEIAELREIDENVNRLAGSDDSHTFHGRDVYAYTGARLASGVISYEEVGPSLKVEEIIALDTQDVVVKDGDVKGGIDILDVRFGSLWSNISKKDFDSAGISFGDRLMVSIQHGDKILYNNIITYGKAFSEVNIGEAIIYINSLVMVGVAINQGNFSLAYNIGTGAGWNIEFKKIEL